MMSSRVIFRAVAFACFSFFCYQLSAQESNSETQSKVAERDRLKQQATEATAAGQLDEAMASLERVLTLEQDILGDTNDDLVETLEQLSQLASAKRDYQALIRYRERQQTIRRNLYGDDDYRTQDTDRSLADAKQRAGFTSEQEADLAQAEALAADMVQFFQEGKLEEATRTARESLELIKRVLGDQHPDYAIGLNNLAFLHATRGDYAQAESLHCEALEKQEKQLGRQHPDFALSLNNLAIIYETMGDYQRAELLHREALIIREKTVGKRHPDYATSLNNLALLYTERGDYSLAEPLYQECRFVLELTLGKQHLHYASALINLGSLYNSTGDYDQAETLYREATTILEAVMGKQHPTYATSLNNLANVYVSMQNYPQAKVLYHQALEIQEKALGKQHPDYALSLHNLAILYHLMGDYQSAEPFFGEALTIWEQVVGSEHPSYASTLNGMAVLYAAMGDDARAESLYRESLEIREKVLSKQHPLYANSLNNLAAHYEARADNDKAEPLYLEAVETTLRNLELTASVQSQRQQVAMGESLRYQLDSYLSLATREPRFQERAYETLLRWKGNVWQRQQRQRLLIDQPSLKTRFADLNAVSSKLSTLILSPPDVAQLDIWHRQLTELSNQREQLERDLALASVEYRQTTTPATIGQLRNALPPGAMLVDYLEYDHFIPANKEHQTAKSVERRLLVYLVQAGREVQAINLGPVQPLNVLVETWRHDFGQGPASIEAAQKLRQFIWEPMGESLDGITTVYVSPDGLLGQFPLAALPGKAPGTYLLEELAIVILPVPQGLPTMPVASTQSVTSTMDRFCLVGGVDYEQTVLLEPIQQSETPPVYPSMTLATRGSEQQKYPALPGTNTEIELIESLLRQYEPTAQATILRGPAASENAFAKLAPGHRYLHVATHGFFAPESVKNALTASSPRTIQVVANDHSRSPKIIGSHPDLLSGLVFAGANNAATTTAEDGILTAAEVQSLDLRGVDLAILSACETGLGKTAGGEGIIGLQRAFQLAGAKTTITSLWHVDDAATQAFMVEFYRNMFERKLDKLESLRQAQIWLLNHPDAIAGKDLSTRGEQRKVRPLAADAPASKPVRSLPVYWAAFQLSGDPR